MFNARDFNGVRPWYIHEIGKNFDTVGEAYLVTQIVEPLLGDILLDDNLELVKDVVYASRFHRLSKCRDFFVSEDFAGVASKLYLLPNDNCKNEEEVVTRLVDEYSGNVMKAMESEYGFPSGMFDTISDVELLRDVTVDSA